MSATKVTEANFESVVLGAVHPVLLDIYADWCNPCRHMAPLIEELSVELEGRAVIGKIDSDANQSLTAKLRIGGLPTFIVFDQGKEVDRKVGIQSREKLLAALGQQTKRETEQ